jgi:hypothetical protein
MMTEFEINELALLANEAGNTALALYMTTVSGYLLVSYVVGAKLTRYQITLVNALFVFFAAAFTYSAAGSFKAMVFYLEELHQFKGGLDVVNTTAENIYANGMAIALIAGMIGSLGFMWNLRRGSQSDV